MLPVSPKQFATRFHQIAFVGAIAFFVSILAMPLRAQQSDAPAVSDKPPSLPVEQIIQKFAEREAEFRKERDNYTYTQTFVIQTIDADNQPDGEYRMTSDIIFTPDGKR